MVARIQLQTVNAARLRYRAGVWMRRISAAFGFVLIGIKGKP